MINLFDYYSQESWDLHYSLLASGYKHPTIVIQDDGFLPDDVTSPYQFFTGFDKLKGRPRYFNEIQVPDLWEITANNQSAQIFEYDKRRANIIYAKPQYRRFVKQVDWLDNQGNIFISDKYNKQGYCFARTAYNSKGQSTSTAYYTADNKEVLVVNHITGDTILNREDKILTFKSQADFVAYYLSVVGFDASRILYNSLATPFFVAHRIGNKGGDILFWQENIRPDIPYNMQLLMDESETKVAVQNRASYEQLKKAMPDEDKLSYLGYLYPLRRQSQYRPSALILTNSDNIEQLTTLVERLPQVTFYIGAITEMSSKLLAYSKYSNVKLFPNISDGKLDELLKICDIYLDINHSNEIFSAVRTAFEQSMLILAFKETQHQTKYIASQNTYWSAEVNGLIQKMESIIDDSEHFKELLSEQYRSLKLGSEEMYRKLIDDYNEGRQGK